MFQGNIAGPSIPFSMYLEIETMAKRHPMYVTCVSVCVFVFTMWQHLFSTKDDSVPQQPLVFVMDCT